MANAIFPFEEYNFGGIWDDLTSTSKSPKNLDGVNMGKIGRLFGSENWGDDGGTDYGFNQELVEEGLLFSKYQQQSYLDYEVFDDRSFDILSPTLLPCMEEIAKLGKISGGIQDASESKKKNQHDFSYASLELLKKYDLGRLSGRQIVQPRCDAQYTKFASQELSTEEIIRIAGARFIQSSCEVVGIPSMLKNPIGLSFSELSDEAAKNVELVEFLLASAEKVGHQQFERASRLLKYCDNFSSGTGNPVQRVVHYFSEALRERINLGTGRISSKGFWKKQSSDLNQEMTTLNEASLACHERIPFFQVARFTGIQAIIDNVAGAKRIHIIDLEIRCGAQWPVLMQALVSRYDCPLELLKISAIGTSSKQMIEDTGKRLASFAESMDIPFSFKVVMVPDMLDLKEDLFELDAEEAIAIYSEYSFMSLIFVPNRLESIMRVLRNIIPRVMVVMEVEANNNSPSFVKRFIESLFFYGSYFDCFDACMGRDDPNRVITELIFFHQGIRNIVAKEGEERIIRHVKIDVWRSFFARFGIIETELSTSSLYQASLVLKKFDCGSSCTLGMNEKSLLIGWKGTPMHSLSVWKFT